MALRVVTQFADHQDVIRSRKDAAILRATHQGCPKCKGNGQIFTKGKDGSFTGSKPCPAPPTKQKASRWEVYKASRFGADKNTGLVGWACPCGKKEKPRYRDAREATKALRTHERNKHGGKSVGGAWYAQTTDAAAVQQPAQPDPVPSKVVTDSGMTDDQWIKQNKKIHPGKAITEGKCWMCAGDGKLHGAFGGQQILAVCPECKGTGKPAVATTS
jgi:Zn finger protein HypA/HybF involved in hydrogenase expression